jgi:glycosyltransferase involved in cell wall biosynthesis
MPEGDAPLRVLVMSHSHPRLTRGGAEISAGGLARALGRSPGVRAWFLGCAPGGGARLGASLTQPFGADDFLYTPAAPFDHFKFASRDAQFPRMVEELVAELRPDIVHAHHYTVFGVEMFATIRRAAPRCRIVLSLHEFLAICHNHGQMVKTGSHRLCREATPPDCARCFPDTAPRDFFLRQLYIQKFLGDVDMFLSPSAFLAERYVAWGLPERRVRVAENMPPTEDAPARMAARAPAPLAGRDIRVGFFGQMSPLKGITVLIEAAAALDAAGVGNLVIDIYGDYSNQPPDFQARVGEALAGAGQNVHYHGPYDNADVLALMRGVDAVVVPSIWWENSPVVIQEALLVGRPVICSDIGGMAEKVRPGLDGLHFPAGRARGLARVLQSVAEAPEILEELSRTLRKPWSADEGLRAHLAIYQGLHANATQG